MFGPIFDFGCTSVRGHTRIVQKNPALAHHLLDQGTASDRDEMQGLVPFEDEWTSGSLCTAQFSQANFCW
jgi:hypothetical protein